MFSMGILAIDRVSSSRDEEELKCPTILLSPESLLIATVRPLPEELTLLMSMSSMSDSSPLEKRSIGSPTYDSADSRPYTSSASPDDCCLL